GRMVFGCERLPEPRDRSLRGAAADERDVLGPDPMSLANAKRAVHVGMRDGAAGVWLERQLFDLPHAAERREEIRETRLVVAAGECLVEPVGTFEDRFRSREARLGEEDRGDAGVC